MYVSINPYPLRKKGKQHKHISYTYEIPGNNLIPAKTPKGSVRTCMSKHTHTTPTQTVTR